LLVKRRLSSTIINGARNVHSVQCFSQRFGGLQKAYEKIGYVHPDKVKLRGKTRGELDNLHRKVIRQLKSIFPEDLTVVRGKMGARATLCFRREVEFAIVLCRFERSSVGNPRWKMTGVSAKHRGLTTLLCRLNRSNTEVFDYYLLPDLLEFPRQGLMTASDTRLCQKKVSRLKSLAKMILSLPKPDTIKA